MYAHIKKKSVNVCQKNTIQYIQKKRENVRIVKIYL